MSFAASGATGSDGGAPSPGYLAPARVRILPLGPEVPENGVLARLAAALEERLGAAVIMEPAVPAEPSWWADEGSRLSSNAIVDTLIDRFPEAAGQEPTEWFLGLTAADLRGGKRDFVFGEAALRGSWAVVGTARFGAPGEERFHRRLMNVALHELGHLAGQAHCSDSGCLMAPAADVNGIDQRAMEICGACRPRAAEAGT